MPQALFRCRVLKKNRVVWSRCSSLSSRTGFCHARDYRSRVIASHARFFPAVCEINAHESHKEEEK